MEISSNIQINNDSELQVHGDMTWYITVLDVEAVDSLYGIEILISYRNHLFSSMGLGHRQLECDYMYICEDNPNIAKKLGFRRADKFYYDKKIYLKEVDKVVIKKTWLKGEKKGSTEIREEEIYSFLKGYPDNL